MGILYVDKCRYEIQEQKEVPVWYTGIYHMYIRSVDTTAVFIITTCFGPYWTIFR
jgi:hypothetical protein